MVHTEDARFSPKTPTAVIQWQTRHQLLIDHPEAFQYKQMQSSSYRLAHNAAEEGNNAGTVGRHWTKAYQNLVKKLQKPIFCKFTVKCKEWWTPAAAHDSRWASSGVPPGVIQSESLCGQGTWMEEAQNALLIAPQHFCLYVAHPHVRVYVCLHARTQKEGELTISPRCTET